MGDRREAKRHQFSATAEVVDMGSGASISSRAADLSERGCYLDSLNPFAIGSNVKVRIFWAGVTFTCSAVVRDSQTGMGMGVAFTDLDDAQKALIASWIEKLDSSPGADLTPGPPLEPAKPTPSPDGDNSLTVKLIDLLNKKGLLTSHDVTTLLRNRTL